MAENEAEAEGGGASLIFLGSFFFYGPLIGSLREDADEPRLSAAGPTILLPSGFGFSFFFLFCLLFFVGLFFISYFWCFFSVPFFLSFDLFSLFFIL